MNWRQPPKTYAELALWKVFVKTQEYSVWGIIHIWVKTYGNPYESVTHTTYDEEETWYIYRMSLDYISNEK